jgi:hypothetical protein
MNAIGHRGRLWPMGGRAIAETVLQGAAAAPATATLQNGAPAQEAAA